MNLSFKQQLNGIETLFVERILSAPLFQEMEIDKTIASTILDPRVKASKIGKLIPKLHTIRADEKERWKEGNNIHFCIANRTKQRLQFAPVVPVVSIQKLQIIRHTSKNNLRIKIRIDGKEFGEAFYRKCQLVYYSESIHKLANNDGFENVYDFFEYFNTNFSGKIIHWTNLKY